MKFFDETLVRYFCDLACCDVKCGLIWKQLGLKWNGLPELLFYF